MARTTTLIEYGPGGYIEGTTNAAGVPAEIPAGNVIRYEQVPYVDGRSMVQHRSPAGEVLDTVVVYDATDGYVGFLLQGDPDHRAFVSYPQNPVRNGIDDYCFIVETLPLNAPDSEVKRVLGATVAQMVQHVMTHRKAPQAAPTLLDAMLSRVKPSWVADAIKAADPNSDGSGVVLTAEEQAALDAANAAKAAQAEAA